MMKTNREKRIWRIYLEHEEFLLYMKKVCYKWEIIDVVDEKLLECQKMNKLGLEVEITFCWW
jgi:hypothetical protein